MKRKRFKAALAVAVAALTLQGCTAWPQADMERLCGHWESTEGKPDVVIRNDGGTHKVTLMSKGERPQIASASSPTSSSASRTRVRTSSSASPRLRGPKATSS